MNPPTRRALLAGAPAIAAAALAGGTVANALAIAEAKAAEADPIFAAIDRHREAVRIHKEAGAHFHELERLEPDFDSSEEWRAWILAECAKGTPRSIAHDRWNDATKAVVEATDHDVHAGHRRCDPDDGGAVMSATVIEFKPKPKSTDEADHPRRAIISGEQWYRLLKMTPRQAEMAHSLCFRNLERRSLTNAALARYIEALRGFEPVLADYRDELMKNMDAYCPRAAMRIREGKPPRRKRKQSA
jgi:hypothetical protein